MTPRVTEAHVEARRRQILDAAAESFAQRGFHQTTMHDIADAADLSAGALYRYFPGKADIIKAMAEEDRDRNAEAFASAGSGHGMASHMRDLAVAFFSQFEDPRFKACTSSVNVELWAEAVRNNDVREVMRESSDPVLTQLAAVVRAAQAQGEINPSLSPESTAHVLVSTFIGLEIQRVTRPEIDIWPYVEAVLAMVTGRFWRGREISAEEVRIDVPN